MAGYIDVEAAISEAKRLSAERTKVITALGIVRDDLRNAVTLGQANAGQAQYIRETFPVRERKSKSKAGESK